MPDIVSVNNNFIQYEENVSVSTGSIATSAVRNAESYSKYGLVVNSPNSGTQVLVQWSADNVNWYHVDFYSTVAATTDVDGSSNSQNNMFKTGTLLAKYIRVRLFDSTASGTCKVILYLLH